MACALTQGYTLDCRDNAGGVKAVWIMEAANVSGITSAAGVITAITKATGKRFWKYNQIRGNSEAKETLQADVNAGTVFYDQSLEIVLTKMQAALRNEITLLAQNYVVAVVQDRNNKYWYYGETNGLTLGTGEAGTGKALGDRNGYGLTFVGQEPALAQEVSSSIVAGLETAG